MLKEFKQFILRGNVLDLAIGVIMGGAFNAIITSIVNDLFMPFVGLLLGGVDFNNWFISLNGTHYDTLAAAEAASAPLLKYGSLLSAVTQFLIIALCLFFIVKGLNKISRASNSSEADEQAACPFCKKMVDATATRCPYCTSEIFLSHP